MSNLKKSPLILSALLFGLSAAALEVPASMPLGYCNGGDKPIENYSDSQSDVWTSGAIYIPASTASTIAGSKISSIRFGIGFAMNIDGAKVWIRTTLDGDDLAVRTHDADTDTKLATGWNELSFDEPWTVPTDCDGFYIGYSLHQKGWSYGLASNTQPCANALFVNIGESGWKDQSQNGTLFVQAMLEGDNLPAANLAIGNCTLPEQIYMNGDALAGTIRLNNLGALPVEGVNLTLLSDDAEIGTVNLDTPLEAGATGKYNFEIPTSFTDGGQCTLSLRVDNPSAEDADPTDNVWSRDVNVLERPLERIVLVEEFSTEKCSNCPSAAQRLHDILEKAENKGRVVAVVHHSGYYTDSFTKAWDNQYTWFYNSSVTYAPAFMIDRYADYGSTPVMQVGSIETSIKNRLAQTPTVALTIEAGFDETDPTKIIARVKGTNYGTTAPVNHFLTLWLTEDNVASISQQGATSSFQHQHLTRDLNATWGQAVSFTDDSFEYSYTFTNVDPTWKQEDLAIVGALHPVKGANPMEMPIANACYAPYASWTAQAPVSGLSITDSDEADAEPEYFDLSGMRVRADRLAPGIYVRRCGSKTEKILVK